MRGRSRKPTGGSGGKIERFYFLAESLCARPIFAADGGVLAGVLLKNLGEGALVGEAGEAGNFSQRVQRGVEQLPDLIESSG